jgi:hypothetical protein
MTPFRQWERITPKFQSDDTTASLGVHSEELSTNFAWLLPMYFRMFKNLTKEDDIWMAAAYMGQPLELKSNVTLTQQSKLADTLVYS